MRFKDKELEAAYADTQNVYIRQAIVWHNQRLVDLYEKVWLERFLCGLPAEARLLDLGCGTGLPIARFFLEKGHQLVGVDYAGPMIDIARSLLPCGDWRVADMRHLDDVCTFDGIYSWDGFFHLSRDEQRTFFETLPALLNKGASLLLTVGPIEGEVTGTVGGETVYHSSLSELEYSQTLDKLGFANVTFVANDADCMGRSVLLATDFC